MNSLLPPRTHHPEPTAPRADPRSLKPATDAQRNYIAGLRRTHDDTGMGETPEHLDMLTASNAIDWLKRRPLRPGEAAVVIARRELDEGFYLRASEQNDPACVYRVVKSDEGRLYVMVLDLHAFGVEQGDKMDWEYGKITYRALCDLATVPITAEVAAMIGRMYERCIFCNRTLSRNESTTAGYGRKCASDHNLPWGDV